MVTHYGGKALHFFSFVILISTTLNSQTSKPVEHNRKALFNLEVPIKMPVKIPEDVLKILQSTPEVKTSGCIEDEAAYGKFSEVWFEATRLHLAGSGNSGLLVKPKNGCLMGANVGPFWIFEKTPKGYELRLTVNALSVEILESTTKGYRDIRAAAVAGGEARSVIYKFDGKQYAER